MTINGKEGADRQPPPKYNYESQKKYRHTQKGREAVSRANKKYGSTHKRKEYMRATKLRLNYGISIEEYNSLLIRQNNKCAICGAEVGWSGRRLGIDHDHDTGEIRGILCQNCNIGIGHLNNVDLLNKAITYLGGYIGT